MALNPEQQDSIQLIGFNAGGKLYAVDILTIREILRDLTIEPIPKAPPFIEGIIRIRGEVIPVINLQKRLGKDASAGATDRNWALVAMVGDRVIAFLVDSVTRILKISTDSIMPAPELILSGLRRQYLKGVCNTELGMLVVLDLNRMLGNDEIKEMKKLSIHQPL